MIQGLSINEEVLISMTLVGGEAALRSYPGASHKIPYEARVEARMRVLQIPTFLCTAIRLGQRCRCHTVVASCKMP